MTESLEIDPFDSDRLLYGTGATIYGTDNLTDWDTGGTVHIDVRAEGLEETAVAGPDQPARPARTCSRALGDVGGFVHTTSPVPRRCTTTRPTATTTGSGLRRTGAPHDRAGRQPHDGDCDPALRHLHRRRRHLDALAAASRTA